MHFHFSTVVWGAWHTSVFLDVNLPSLLASNNLPAFAALHKVSYRILTSAESSRQIEASSAFRRARQIVDFELFECDIDPSVSPIELHHRLWRRSMEEAKAAKAMILFVPPDVVWADGSLKHVAKLAAAGKRAIFMTYMRVVAEECVPEVRKRHLASDEVVVEATPRQLVELAMQYIHPLTLTYLRNSPNFPVHPEFVLWSIAGEGMLMRVLVREMFAFDPAMFQLNQNALLANVVDQHLVHYITDSDDLFALSLAPLTKDIDWYSNLGDLDIIKLGYWWLTYDSPANDLVADLSFYVHTKDRTSQEWRRAELQSNAFIRRLRSTREILRFLRPLVNLDSDRAIDVAMLALVETKLASVFPTVDVLTVLMPTNGAIVNHLTVDGFRFLRPSSSRLLINLILDHCIIGALDMRPGEDVFLTTVRGRRRTLSWRGEIPLIDGVAVCGKPYAVSTNYKHISRSGLSVSDVLPAIQD